MNMQKQILKIYPKILYKNLNILDINNSQSIFNRKKKILKTLI